MAVKITVLVNWYAHDRYAQEAVESVLRQETSAEFEVIILSPNPAPKLPPDTDHIAADRGISVRTLQVPAGPVGEALASASKLAKGEVISLLDDDDLWEPAKLEAVATAFGNERVTFFHNGQTFVDEQNIPLSPLNPHRLVRHPSSLRVRRRSVLVDASNPRSIGRGRSFEPDFNNSSVSVRRSLLLRYLDPLKRVDRGEDTFLYYCALASQQLLLLSTERLTRYRIHPGGVTASNTSPGLTPEWLAPYAVFARKQYLRLQLVRESCLADAIPELRAFLDSDQALWSTLLSVATASPDETRISQRVRFLIGDEFARPRPREFLAAGLGIVASVAPRIAQAGLRTWRRIW